MQTRIYTDQETENTQVNLAEQNPEEDNSNQGFCLLQRDEIIKIENLILKVITFDKKTLQVEILGENVDELIKGKEVRIKAGKFIVKSFGKKFAMFRTKAATTIYDQRVLDEVNRQKIEQIRKEA